LNPPSLVFLLTLTSMLENLRAEVNLGVRPAC
jgi:hypothetical protein